MIDDDAAWAMEARQLKASAMKMLSLFLRDESAATAIEFSLIAGLVSIVIVGAVTTIGTTLNGKFTQISTTLS